MRAVRWRMADGGWQLAMAAAVVVIVVVVLVVVAVVVVGAGVFGIGAKRGAAGRECLRFWAEGLEYVEAGYVRHGAAVDEQLVKGAAVGFPSPPHLHLQHHHRPHHPPKPITSTATTTTTTTTTAASSSSSSITTSTATTTTTATEAG